MILLLLLLLLVELIRPPASLSIYVAAFLGGSR
jgi:hypothetical protein